MSRDLIKARGISITCEPRIQISSAWHMPFDHTIHAYRLPMLTAKEAEALVRELQLAIQHAEAAAEQEKKEQAEESAAVETESAPVETEGREHD